MIRYYSYRYDNGRFKLLMVLCIHGKMYIVLFFHTSVKKKKRSKKKRKLTLRNIKIMVNYSRIIFTRYIYKLNDGSTMEKIKIEYVYHKSFVIPIVILFIFSCDIMHIF